MSNRWKLIIGGLAGATVAAATIGGGLMAAASPPPTSEPCLRCREPGEGTITVAPNGDGAGRSRHGHRQPRRAGHRATGAEAMEQVNTSSAALTEALVASGIAEEDIQTSGLSL